MRARGEGGAFLWGGSALFSTSGGKGRLSHARLRELARSTVSSRRGERGEESGEGGARGGKRRRRRDESEGEKTSPKTKGPGSRRPAKRFSSVGGGGPVAAVGRRGFFSLVALFSRSGPGPARRAFFLFTSEGAPPPSLSLAQGRTRSSRAEARAARSLSLSREVSFHPASSLRSRLDREKRQERRSKLSLSPWIVSRDPLPPLLLL